MGIVLPAKRHLVVGEVHKPVVGDGYTVRVARQILQHMFRAAEGWFGVDYPVVAEQTAQERQKDFLVSQWLERSGQTEFAAAIQQPEAGNEFAAEHAAQDFDRQEESVAWTYPAFVIRREPPCRNHTVHVRMVEKVLAPGVQHAEESDLRAEMFRIGGYLKQSGCAGTEQKAVEQLLVVYASEAN